MILLAHGLELHNPIVIAAIVSGVTFLWRMRRVLFWREARD